MWSIIIFIRSRVSFSAKIYHKNKNIPFYKKWVTSELITWCCLTILMLCIGILSLNKEFLKISFLENLSLLLAILSLLLLIIAGFKRFFEHEKLNGKLQGEISLNENSIIINNETYLFNKIKDFKIGFGNKYGDLTGNTKIGPMYSQGLNNSVSFYNESKYIEVFFQLKTENQLNSLKQDLYFYVINEVLPLNTRTLQYVDKKFKHTNEFKNLIHKYIKNGTFSCTEGLLIIGYSSDKEASELRKKYCS